MGARCIRLNTVLTRRRQPISISVLTYRLLCSFNDRSPKSQSRYIVGTFVHVNTCTNLWNPLPAARNSSEVISLMITIASE